MPHQICCWRVHFITRPFTAWNRLWLVAQRRQRPFQSWGWWAFQTWVWFISWPLSPLHFHWCVSVSALCWEEENNVVTGIVLGADTGRWNLWSQRVGSWWPELWISLQPGGTLGYTGGRCGWKEVNVADNSLFRCDASAPTAPEVFAKSPTLLWKGWVIDYEENTNNGGYFRAETTWARVLF